MNYLARAYRLTFDTRRDRACLALGRLGDVEVMLAKPQTFMNLSGLSVASLVRRYRISLADLVVICDDADLPLGRIRLRFGGSAGGHKGVQSIIDHLSNQSFPRLRVGIGRPLQSLEEGIMQHVLGNFTIEEQAIMDGAYPRVAEAVCCLLTEGMAAAMNRYN